MMKDSSVMVPPLIPEIFILSNLNKDGPPDDIYLENNSIHLDLGTYYICDADEATVGYGRLRQPGPVVSADFADFDDSWLDE